MDGKSFKAGMSPLIMAYKDHSSLKAFDLEESLNSLGTSTTAVEGITTSADTWNVPCDFLHVRKEIEAKVSKYEDDVKVVKGFRKCISKVQKREGKHLKAGKRSWRGQRKRVQRHIESKTAPGGLARVAAERLYSMHSPPDKWGLDNFSKEPEFAAKHGDSRSVIFAFPKLLTHTGLYPDTGIVSTHWHAQARKLYDENQSQVNALLPNLLVDMKRR